MNFLIVSRISIPAKDRTLPCWRHLRSLGHHVEVEHPDTTLLNGFEPDVLICMGVTIMNEAFRALERWPNAPLFVYQWDTYAWIWEPGQEGKQQAKHISRPNEYDYVEWGKLLWRAQRVWVPSLCTGVRTTQWWGIPEAGRNHGRVGWERILSACPWWDWPENDIRDDGYALMCLREIPDPWWGVFEECCAELKIPYRCTRHECSYQEYQEAVAHCRFLCAPLYELSTGGLSLMEGYYLGKPVLLSNSEYNGGRDYFGVRASYFKHGDREDFKSALRRMHDWFETPTWGRPDRDEQKQYITENFSDRRMVDDMLRSIGETCLR